MFKGKEVPRFEIPAKCPRCRGLNLLDRKGFYKRQVVDEESNKYLVKIVRVRCRGCRASYSLLYDFLVPYRKYTVKALEKAVVEYIREPSSYLEASGVMEPATLFSAIECLLAQMPLIWMFLMRRLTDAGLPVKQVAKEAVCPNSFKCKKERKRQVLDWARRALELVPELSEFVAPGGLSVFASGRGCRLLRTHSAECALF